MDNVEVNKVRASVRKVKKKQGKDEMDRLKQAEKKKRRLEKALATSAAIRSELEKKKLKKKEEQQRLDEEGAAIAEAVALHVLCGEDSEDSHKTVLNKFEGSKPWGGPNCSLEGIGVLPGDHVHGFRWGGLGSGNWSFSSGIHGRDLCALNINGAGRLNAESSAGIIAAAQAVSSLRIQEEARVDSIFVDGMLRG